LRLSGAPLERANIQTVARQLPAVGRRASAVTLWLNPFCFAETLYGPGLNEPVITTGPTKLVSGFYLIGGPPTPFSTPQCARPTPSPGAGVVEVVNSSGSLVAAATSSRGQFVELALPAGVYAITGTFLDATVNGTHPKQTRSVLIPAGDSVRRDFFLNVQ
jgi:hypothetical protein